MRRESKRWLIGSNVTFDLGSDLGEASSNAVHAIGQRHDHHNNHRRGGGGGAVPRGVYPWRSCWQRPTTN